MKTRNKKPLPKSRRSTGVDPTRLGGVKRAFVASLRRNFESLKSELLHTVPTDGYGITYNCGGKGGKPGPCPEKSFTDVKESVVGKDRFDHQSQEALMGGSHQFNYQFGGGHSLSVSLVDPSTVRIDFGSRGKSTAEEIGVGLDKGTLPLLRKVREIVKVYHGAGYAIRFHTGDQRRDDFYTKSLSKLGLKKVKDEEGGQVFNASQDSFRTWIESAIAHYITSPEQERAWGRLVETAFRRGVERSFDESPPVYGETAQMRAGRRGQFLNGVYQHQGLVFNEMVLNCGGKGGKPGPCPATGQESVTPPVKKSVFAAARETEAEFNDAVVHVLGGKVVSPGLGRRDLDAGRYVTARWAYGKKEIRLDFAIEGRPGVSTSEAAESASFALARYLRSVVKQLHEKGFALSVHAGDKRRDEAYTRILSKMGLKESGGVWNSLVDNSFLSRGVDKVKLLSSRAFNDVRGWASKLVTQVTSQAGEWLLQGAAGGPEQKIADLIKQVNASVNSAFASIVQTVTTETTRSFASGQLEGMKQLGATHVQANVEWNVVKRADGKPDSSVCPRCRPLDGVVFTVEEAEGKIPLHPSCRCCWVTTSLEKKNSPLMGIVKQKRVKAMTMNAKDALGHGSEKRGTGSGTIYDKHGVAYRVLHDGDRNYTISVPGKEEMQARGVTAGGVQLKVNKKGVSSVGVHREFQRRGLATALYNHIEQHLGHPLEENWGTTPDGEAFWKSRKKTTNSLLSTIGRFEEMLINSFCPTGKGGGVDPTCSPSHDEDFYQNHFAPNTELEYKGGGGLGFYEAESDKWLRSSDAEARQNAWDYATRDFPELGDYLRMRDFGMKEGIIVLFRSGGASGGDLHSYFPNRQLAETYAKRFDGGTVDVYTGRIEEVLPSGSGSGEVWAYAGDLKHKKSIDVTNEMLINCGGKGGKPGPCPHPHREQPKETFSHLTDDPDILKQLHDASAEAPRASLTSKLDSQGQSPEHYTGTVGGLRVRTHIPNEDSMNGFPEETSTVLKGIREVPMSLFDKESLEAQPSKRASDTTQKLVDAIRASKEINPLIAVKDKKGWYILEGNHRAPALSKLGLKSFPAKVIVDHEGLTS